MDEVNERSTAIITAAFTDEDNEAVIPTSGTYRIDDIGSGSGILAETNLPSLAASVDITITPVQNRILTETNPHEYRKVTIVFGYGDSKQGTEKYDYKVKNLYGVTT